MQLGLQKPLIMTPFLSTSQLHPNPKTSFFGLTYPFFNPNPIHSLSMADSILRSNHRNKALHLLGLFFFFFFLLIERGGAREFKVGDSTWTVPTDPSAPSYNQWAEKNRFLLNDSIVFDYPAGKDSVLLVEKEAYANCNTTAFNKSFSDGHTVFTFDHSGPFYFISGIPDNCLKNEKVVIVVLADRSNRTSNTNQTTAASPPPSESAGIVPSPAPAGEESPSPPGTVQINPTPAPESTPPPPSGASSIFISFISSLGAFVGSSLLLVF